LRKIHQFIINHLRHSRYQKSLTLFRMWFRIVYAPRWGKTKMASIHKDLGDATWRAAFSCIVGTARVRVKRTTGTADRKLAGRIADFLEDVAGGLLRPEEIHSFIAKISETRAKRAARRGADEVLKLVTGRGLGGDSLRTYSEGWLARTRGEVAGRSIAKYETAVHRFLEMLGTRADLDLQAIEQKDVVFFRDQLAKRLAASSVNSDLKIIRSMFTAAERDLLNTRNPARLVRALKVHDTGGERRSFTLESSGGSMRLRRAKCADFSSRGYSPASGLEIWRACDGRILILTEAKFD
jgi:hypothetical protein